MTGTATATVTAAAQSRFPGELRRWRELRRWSQLELAVRAGTTQRHISFMERGRSRPGRAIVIRIAESLELSLRERNDLLVAAGYVPVFAESGLGGTALRPVRAALERILEGHLPFPAVVVRPYGELVAANAAVDLLVAGCPPALLTPPVNVLRLALHPDGMAKRVVNLPEWGRHIVDSLRVRALHSPDPGLDALVAELVGYLPAVAPGPDHLGFAVPLRLRHDTAEGGGTAEAEGGELRLITTRMSFATAVDVSIAELELEAFLPADDETAAVLRALDERRDPDGSGPSLRHVRAW